MRSMALLILVAFAQCLIAQDARAVTVTATATSTLYGLDANSMTLLTIDTDTGSSSIVGVGRYIDFHNDFAVGLAYNRATGVMYARSFDNLYNVDLNTGATTLIGASPNFITGLTFDGGFTTLYSISQFDGSFYSINPVTASTTLIGRTGFDRAVGLSTRSDGTIFGATLDGELFTIDPGTGVGTIVGAELPGLTEIAFDENDVLYGVALLGDHLGIIDPAYSSFSPIGTAVARDVRGLAFAISVPEPNTLLVTLSLASGFIIWRRYR